MYVLRICAARHLCISTPCMAVSATGDTANHCFFPANRPSRPGDLSKRTDADSPDSHGSPRARRVNARARRASQIPSASSGFCAWPGCRASSDAKACVTCQTGNRGGSGATSVAGRRHRASIGEGQLYCATVMDIYSRPVIGCFVDDRQISAWSRTRSRWPWRATRWRSIGDPALGLRNGKHSTGCQETPSRHRHAPLQYLEYRPRTRQRLLGYWCNSCRRPSRIGMRRHLSQ